MVHVESVKTGITMMKERRNVFQESVMLDQESPEMVNVRHAQHSSMLLTTKEIVYNAIVEKEKSAKKMVHANNAKITSS
jgi:hypothetical protein